MRAALAFTVFALGLAACSGKTSPEAELRAACEIVAADPEGQQAITDMNATPESFCTCLNAHVLAMADDDQTKVRAALIYIADQATQTGQEVEDIAVSIIREGMAFPDGEGVQTIIEGVPLVGQAFDDVEDKFDQGTCTRAA
ncbi:MAG: hypothetical protein AAF296_06505 [Pseudomonadota bacterium]